MKTILTDPAADAELENAAEWYEKQKEGLGARFLDAVAGAVLTVQRSPTAFPLFQGTSIRRYAVPRFPYVIFFEVFPDHIWIYAFAHSKRKPGYWLTRIENPEAPDRSSE